VSRAGRGTAHRMHTDWHDLGSAFALYLVLEGVLPFLNPAAAQRLFAAIAQAPAGQLRVMGLVSMLVGWALLYYLRG
jgi:uncharacterized protein YjeT (DUF2065 family)